MRWHEVRDVAIAIVHVFWAIRGEACPDCTEAERVHREDRRVRLAADQHRRDQAALLST